MKKISIFIVLGFLIYGLSLSNGFVWDDEFIFQKGGNTMLANIYFRPAISAVYLTIYNIFGPRPFSFHFFQLIFHIATAILIFYLFKRFFKETISFFLALIFLIHPASVEAVSFTSAMQEVAFTLTGIIGLYIFVSSENLSLTKVFFATLLLFMALLMKETAIVFFVLVFCYLVIFKRKQTNVLVNYSIFTAILLIIYFLARILSGNLYVQGQGLFPIMRVSLAIRLMNIPSIIKYYLSMFLYPINLTIAQHWVIKTPDFTNFFLPLILEVLLVSSAVIYSIKKKNKIFIFFFLWFLVGLLPHLQIIPLNMTVAERWLYFPMIGLLGMMGSVIENLKIKNKIYKIIFFSLATIISLLSYRSYIRTFDWRNGLILFGHDINKTSSFDLQNNFGTELFRAGRYDEAKKYFEISTKLAPYWWVNWNNVGAVYEIKKNYQKAAEYYRKSIDNGPYYLAYENLARILVLYGKDQEKTEVFLKEALGLFPENENLIKINDFYNQLHNQK